MAPIPWGVAIGILMGLGSLFLAASTSCGLCTHVTFAQALFPYALIADPSLSNHALDAFLAGVQWPLYGAIVSMSLMALTKKKALLVIGALVIIHVFSVVEANRRVNAFWESKRLGSIDVLVRGAI